MIGGRKVRSNKGKRRGHRGTGKTRSGTPFRGRKVSAKRRSTNKSRKTRKTRSNKGKRRGPRTGVTRSNRKIRGRGNIKGLLRKLSGAQ